MATTCLVVMGVSGAGKTTIAELLAERLGWQLAEADEFHPEANIDKMSAGIPLTDADRAPWLAAIRDWITTKDALGRDTVVTCSALKRSYRAILGEAESRVRFVFLSGGTELIASRLSRRSGHFMPPDLLGSQVGDLEPLAADEDGITVDISAPPSEIADTALRELGLP
ncbi:gluconate kinase [Prauserella marina]|uniref:Gluconokinase n=1 Tax=Prauserella marina TaxID=530584 RepID=A0A222VNI7_9PSEU|nr:gluconokinase [Prauserella marina]ASR35480.1 gluconate kinase [Prauserella marina]PWV84701.1 gluconokinase [Prauserella marina]SDC15378.1 gluconokinase [Prauserella marina]